MDQQLRTRLVGGSIALMLLAVGWSMVSRARPPRAARRPPPLADTTPLPGQRPRPRPAAVASSPAGCQATVAESVRSQPQPGFMDMVARAEIRRRIRASFPYTYLSTIVGESSDSTLHRWDDRVGRPVRVFLATDTVNNFQ